jgi:2-polyprenyl-3-methyl-5-hydroxy-6-metoxy-1,4-benzoquinol methylase
MTRLKKWIYWNPSDVGQFWDEKSSTKEDYYSFKHGKSIIGKIETMNLLHSSQSVLDYGCGPGYLMEHLSTSGYRKVSGCDFSHESVKVAKERFEPKGMKVFHIDECHEYRQLFDVIIVSEIIEHLYDNDLRLLLENIDGLLSDNGKVIFTTPNNEKIGNSISFSENLNGFIHKWQHVRSWNKISIESWLALNGFECEHIEELDWRNTRLPNALHLLARFFLGRRLTLPNLFVTAKKNLRN